MKQEKAVGEYAYLGNMDASQTTLYEQLTSDISDADERLIDDSQSARSPVYDERIIGYLPVWNGNDQSHVKITCGHMQR